MKPVILLQPRRFTKGELVDQLYIAYEDVTSRRELNRLVTRKHVLEYGQEVLDMEKEYGSAIGEDQRADYLLEFAMNIGTDLGLQERLESMESFTKP